MTYVFIENEFCKKFLRNLETSRIINRYISLHLIPHYTCIYSHFSINLKFNIRQKAKINDSEIHLTYI